jgi:hypothetical protein
MAPSQVKGGALPVASWLRVQQRRGDALSSQLEFGHYDKT